MRKRNDESGFITMIVVIVAVLILIIWFAFSTVSKANG